MPEFPGGKNFDADKLKQQLQALAKNIPNEIAAALFQECQSVMKVSMQRTPVLTGALRASHRSEKPEINGQNISVAITVGGPAAGYAFWVHENLDAEHKTGQAKFLESAILEAIPTLPGKVMKRVDFNRAMR